MMLIIYASLENALSFGKAVTSVCQEEKYLSNTTGYNEEETLDFVRNIIEKKHAQYYAIIKGVVVGWCDIVRKPQEFHSHIGVLGMGIIKDYRRQGIGKKLTLRTIEHAQKNGIEKIELEVFESNVVAKNFYERMGFKVEGIKKDGKKYKNQYENVIMMGLNTKFVSYSKTFYRLS